MRKVAAFVLALVGLFAVVGLAMADDGGRPFTVTLAGENERPGPGDPDGSGTATIRLNPGQQEVCWDITVSDIALPATGAHIHIAPETDPGPVVVHLGAPDASGTSRGCTTDVSRELIKAIIQNPEAYYVNVHSTEYRPGAVRGQLSK